MAAMAIGTGATSNALVNFLPGAFKQLKMMFCLRQAISDMDSEVERLMHLMEGMNEELNQAQEEPSSVVKNWLKKAASYVDRSKCIKNVSEQACPNFFCRYKINQDIKAWVKRVSKLHEEKQSDFPDFPKHGGTEITPSTYTPFEIPKYTFIGNIIQFAQSTLERWLTDEHNDDIRIIGVYGMGGVGKTSLLQVINNSLNVRNSFELIVWVTVSKDYDILDLQKNIANRLNLTKFPEKSDPIGREDKLRTYLSTKKYLLILDDMWDSLELSKLGVSWEDKEYKVVISTRYKNVLSRMNAEESVEINPLTKEDSWELFCSRAFCNGVIPSELEDVAKRTAWGCRGLPLAINVIAAAMKPYSDPIKWELALYDMQHIEETYNEMPKEIENDLFQRLRWSYDLLPPHLKDLFVYFAAYSEDEEINCLELIEMWIAEGLVKCRGELYLPDIALTYIKDLCDCCLIQAIQMDCVGRITEVKMHDVLRDFATKIAWKEQHCFFNAGQSVKDFPKMEGFEDCLRMSLIGCSLRSLPITFPCPSILVLILKGCSHVKEVPEMFLKQMTLLKVLDLSKTGITTLAPCIGDLEGLTFLQLQGTEIINLPESIGRLSKLLFLNLAYCFELRYLPTSIGNLKCLVAFNIEYCEKLSIIPRVISELGSLQRLMMYDSIDLEFDAIDDNANERRNYLCMKDLQSLCDLRELSVSAKSPIRKGVFKNWLKMRELGLDFSDTNQHFLPEDMKAMKDELESLFLDNCNMIEVPSWVGEFRKLSCLTLYGCNELKELPEELYELLSLRKLYLHGCGKLKKLNLGRQGACFQNLEKLDLYVLKSLESIIKGRRGSIGGVLGEGALPMLKSLEVCYCEKLKRLPLGMDKLRCLQEIRGGQQWWDAIQWQDDVFKTSLQTKFRPLSWS